MLRVRCREAHSVVCCPLSCPPRWATSPGGLLPVLGSVLAVLVEHGDDPDGGGLRERACAASVARTAGQAAN